MSPRPAPFASRPVVEGPLAHRGRRLARAATVRPLLRCAFRLSLLLAPGWSGGGLAAQEPGTVAGMVLDAESGEPVPDVLVHVQGSELRSLSDAEGRFRIEGVPGGEHRLLFRHLAYGEHTREVTLGGAGLELQVLMSPEAIELSPLVVEATGEREQRRRFSGNSRAEIGFEEIQAAARTGIGLSDLLRQMPGVRMRPGGAGECIEFRQLGVGPICRNMTILIDGQLIADPASLLMAMDLDVIEHLEVLSPSEAGARYGGASANGVLLIETRTGTLAARPATIASRTRTMAAPAAGGPLSAFDWSSFEPDPYPWGRVLATTFVSNLLVAGLTYLPLAWCTEVWDGSLKQRRCSAAGALGSGVAAMGVPGAAAGLVARRAGTTERSRGSLASTTLGTLFHLSGHVLLLHGKNRGSGVAEVAGLAVVAVGTPLIVTISDRFFRALR